MAAEPGLVIPEVELTDPLTGKRLNPELAEVVREVNDSFFKDFKAEAHTNGLVINTITEFYRHVKGKERQEEGGIPQWSGDALDSEDEGESEENVKKALEDDDMVLEHNSDSESASDLDDGIEASDGEESEPSEEDDEQEVDGVVSGSSRLAKLNEAKQRQRLASKRSSSPTHYDPLKFKPLSCPMDPKQLSQLKYLTKTFSEPREFDSDDEEEMDDQRTMPFDMTYENECSEFRANAASFREYYKKLILPKEVNTIHINSVPARDRHLIFNKEDFYNEKPTVVVDESGTAYVGGHIKPNNFPQGHLGKIYVKMDKPGMVRVMRCFRSADKKGPFIFVWPDDRIGNVYTIPDAQLTRISLHQYDAAHR
uniref:Uncharacterized protein n=1 Tax=Caenorhabditis japonica TaxID=281687 RepID=A0A8R1HSI9_CAEJA